ncbi:MAG: hypothetical protein AB7W59_03280 [Acidimicrobiia bacterium]
MTGQLQLFAMEPVDGRPRARQRAAAATSTPAGEGTQLSLFEAPVRAALYAMTRASERIVPLRGAARRSVERVIERAQCELTYWRRWLRPDGGA